MDIDCSAPTRIDLAGGTYDIWPLYLLHDGAQTLNAAISLRAHCRLTSRRDHRLRLISEDTGETVDVADPSELDLSRLPLVARIARHFGARGVDIQTRSDSPVGAGIAGSSAMAVAVATALASWTGRTVDPEDLLTIAMNIEAQVLGVPTGVQDYRPAMYGGVMAIEMGLTGVQRAPIPVDPRELERRIVLAYTGASRHSGINNWAVMMRRIEGDPAVIAAFDGIRDAAAGMRQALEREAWRDVAAALAAEWECRKRLAPAVTTPEIEQILYRAREAGALAGKVCGAGGGGCLFCLVEPDRRASVVAAIAATGAMVLPVSIDSVGVSLVRS